AAACRIGYAGQVLGALLGHCLIEVDRHPDDRKPAKAEGGSIRNVANRIVKARIDLALGAHSPTVMSCCPSAIMRDAARAGNPGLSPRFGIGIDQLAGLVLGG